MSSTRLKDEDILVNIVGATLDVVGRTAPVPKKIPPTNITQAMALVRIHSPEYLPYYVAIFLLTKYGKGQLHRLARPTGQYNINLPELRSVQVVKLSISQQELIQEYVEQSMELRKKSEQFYAEAEQLLLSALGLDRLDLSPQLSYSATFDEVAETERFDAEYYQPKYYQILSAIKRSGYTVQELEQLIEPIRNGFDYRNYSEEGTPYIRVGDVRNGRIDIEGAARVPIISAEIEKNVGLQINDVLFTRKGTFGHAAVVREGQEHCIISSEIMLLRLQQNVNLPVLADYLALFLNSDVGYQQVERKVHGVAYYSISQPDLAAVQIAIPPLSIQEKIAQKVQDSLNTEQEAQHLLETAKQRVEQMILEGV